MSGDSKGAGPVGQSKVDIDELRQLFEQTLEVMASGDNEANLEARRRIIHRGPRDKKTYEIDEADLKDIVHAAEQTAGSSWVHTLVGAAAGAAPIGLFFWWELFTWLWGKRGAQAAGDVVVATGLDSSIGPADGITALVFAVTGTCALVLYLLHRSRNKSDKEHVSDICDRIRSQPVLHRRDIHGPEGVP